MHVKKDPTPQERRGFEATRDRQDKAAKLLRESMDALTAHWNKLMKDVPKSEWYTPANSAKWQKMYQEMRESPGYKKQMAEYEKARQDLKKYVDAASSGPTHPPSRTATCGCIGGSKW